MHDFFECFFGFYRVGHTYLGNKKIRNAVGVKMQPVKGCVTAAFLVSAVLHAGKKQYHFAFIKLEIFFSFVKRNRSLGDKNKLKAVDCNHGVRPRTFGIEQSHVRKCQINFVVKRNHVGFFHLLYDFLIDNIELNIL